MFLKGFQCFQFLLYIIWFSASDEVLRKLLKLNSRGESSQAHTMWHLVRSDLSHWENKLKQKQLLREANHDSWLLSQMSLEMTLKLTKKLQQIPGSLNQNKNNSSKLLKSCFTLKALFKNICKMNGCCQRDHLKQKHGSCNPPLALFTGIQRVGLVQQMEKKKTCLFVFLREPPLMCVITYSCTGALRICALRLKDEYCCFKLQIGEG